jgi:hypothetical protein
VSYYFLTGIFIISRIFSWFIIQYLVDIEKRFKSSWKKYLFSFLVTITFYDAIYVFKKQNEKDLDFDFKIKLKKLHKI